MRKHLGHALVLFVVAFSFAQSAHAQIEVWVFGNPSAVDLIGPSYAGVIAQGRDGNLYSTAPEGGFFGLGGIFSVTYPDGRYSKPWTFMGTFGSNPASGLTLGSDGYFYGTASAGGLCCGDGIIFKVDPAFTTLTMLYQFTGADGQEPNTPPIEAADGNFYGTTPRGGLNNGGTIYKISPSGTFTLLYSFLTENPEETPGPPLVQGTDGNFYGVTSNGGMWGTIFKFTSQGVFTTLHQFDYDDGYGPTGLVQAPDGSFYGTTSGGGSTGFGEIFKISNQGNFTILYTFQNQADGAVPFNSLIQASDGNFYGVTAVINGAQQGQLYRITPAGVFSVVSGFGGIVADYCAAPLIEHTSGRLYGDCRFGEIFNAGIFYEFDLGLKPFVALVPHLGKAGKTIGILGQGFSAATAVSFNGVPATTFQAVSDTFLTVTIPNAATTGKVAVTIPPLNLVSKQSFRVTPVIGGFTPASGPVGTAVTIKGISLKQTTRVSFGNVAATSFTVSSNKQITVTVPAGAVTGKIVVNTAGGTAVTSAPFAITP